MNKEPIIKIFGLTKIYYERVFFAKKSIRAVENLNFEVCSGEVFGFLGPNGAGKTTTLNMIIGITNPTSGFIEIFGRRFSSRDVKTLARIGFVPETSFLPGYFSIEEMLNFYGQIFCIPRQEKRRRINELLEMVGLLKEKRTLLKNLSMGQRRLVDFVQSLINDPDIVILDEPTVYLDPIILERFRSTLKVLKENKKTILMSSQVLSEIQKVSDRVAVINKGRLLKVGERDEFVKDGDMEGEFLRIIKNAESM